MDTKRVWTPEQLERLGNFLNQQEQPCYIFLDEAGNQLDVENFATPGEAFEHAKTLDVPVVDVTLWLGFMDRHENEPKVYTFMEELNDIGKDART